MDSDARQAASADFSTSAFGCLSFQATKTGESFGQNALRFYSAEKRSHAQDRKCEPPVNPRYEFSDTQLKLMGVRNQPLVASIANTSFAVAGRKIRLPINSSITRRSSSTLCRTCKPAAIG